MLPKKPASPDEIALYCHLGEALCKTQILEQALSHSIALKKNSEATQQIADEHLTILRSYTLGKAIYLSGKDQLCTSSLQHELNSFLEMRNWLVHKAMFESMNDLYTELARNKLFQKIKGIASAAENLQRKIELDMMDFCEARGSDMSKIRKILNAQ